MTRASARWWPVLALAAAALVVWVLVWPSSGGDARAREGDDPAAAASPPPRAASSAGSWQTIAHEGVEVEVPAGWARSDTSECQFETARWGRPGSDPCAFEDGVVCYGADLSDPAHRPGLVRTATHGVLTWSGYAYTGRFAVYVFENADRDVVRHVLASARAGR